MVNNAVEPARGCRRKARQGSEAGCGSERRLVAVIEEVRLEIVLAVETPLLLDARCVEFPHLVAKGIEQFKDGQGLFGGPVSLGCWAVQTWFPR